MSLRPRQTKALLDITAAYKSGKVAPVLVASTGFGKTHTSVAIIERALAKGKRVWFLAHLREILDATSEKLTDHCIAHSWVMAGRDYDPRASVQIVSVQTATRRLDRLPLPDFIIVDEAHLAVAQTYQIVFEWAKAGPKFWQKGGAHLLHLTATPQRLDGRGMDEVADCIVPTCGMQTLIDEGLLAPMRYLAPSAPDLSGVRSLGGDFKADELAAAMDKPTITGSAVREYTRHAAGRPAIAFCVSIKHAEHVAQEFRAAGYRALAISGDTDNEVRDAALRDVQSGRLDVVCNCALWVAGVDAPAVSCIILLAPTKSITKFRQSVGRGARTAEGKDDFIVLDHAGNVQRHGLPTDEIDWDLAGTVQRRKAKADEGPSVKVCPSCFAAVRSFVTDCICGHHFESQERKVAQVEGDLQEITAGQKKEAVQAKMARIEQGRHKTIDQLVQLGMQRGFKRPRLWAEAVYRARIQKEASK